MNDQNISIIIPAYNEEAGIKACLDELLASEYGQKAEIVVINDGSSDATEEIVAKFDKIRLINHPYNKGYGAALKTGIHNCTGDIVILFDADGQHDPAQIVKLLDDLNGFDMIVGARSKGSDQDWIRKPGKFLLKLVASILSDQKIPDLNSGFRAIRRNVIVNMLDLFPDGFSFSTTSTIAFFKLGYNVKYVPITTRAREGKSTVRQYKHGPQVLLLIIRLITLFSPLRIFLNVSAILFTLGFAYQVEEIIRRGFHFVNGALLLILSSVLVFLFGLIADQISNLRLSLHKVKNEDNHN